MMNLIPSPMDPFTIYGNVVAAKHSPRKERLELLAGTIEALYQNYHDHRLDLSGLLAHGYVAPEKDDLTHCYSVPTAPLGELQSEILNQQPVQLRRLCPYCSINNHDAFDHYLPMNTYSEFSVNALNLLPCCTVCNMKKGDRVLDDGGRRRFGKLVFRRIADRAFSGGQNRL